MASCHRGELSFTGDKTVGKQVMRTDSADVRLNARLISIKCRIRAVSARVARGEQRRDLAVDELPVDLARELHSLVPHVDDLVQPRAEQISRSCRLVLLRPHRSLRCGDRIMLLDSRESRKRNCKLPGPQT